MNSRKKFRSAKLIIANREKIKRLKPGDLLVVMSTDEIVEIFEPGQLWNSPSDIPNWYNAIGEYQVDVTCKTGHRRYLYSQVRPFRHSDRGAALAIKTGIL